MAWDSTVAVAGQFADGDPFTANQANALLLISGQGVTARPLPNNAGMVYWDTEAGILYRSDGTEWVVLTYTWGEEDQTLPTGVKTFPSYPRSTGASSTATNASLIPRSEQDRRFIRKVAGVAEGAITSAEVAVEDNQLPNLAQVRGLMGLANRYGGTQSFPRVYSSGSTTFFDGSLSNKVSRLVSGVYELEFFASFDIPATGVVRDGVLGVRMRIAQCFLRLYNGSGYNDNVRLDGAWEVRLGRTGSDTNNPFITVQFDEDEDNESRILYGHDECIGGPTYLSRAIVQTTCIYFSSKHLLNYRPECRVVRRCYGNAQLRPLWRGAIMGMRQFFDPILPLRLRSDFAAITDNQQLADDRAVLSRQQDSFEKAGIDQGATGHSIQTAKGVQEYVRRVPPLQRAVNLRVNSIKEAKLIMEKRVKNDEWEVVDSRLPISTFLRRLEKTMSTVERSLMYNGLAFTWYSSWE